jgi:hypothetical protein
MSPASDYRDAIIVSYFRDITASLGVPIVVLLFRNRDEVEVHVRQDWHPVTAYDQDADLEFLRSFIIDNLPKLKQGMSGLTMILGAENFLRAEKLAGTDPNFDQKLADAILGF